MTISISKYSLDLSPKPTDDQVLWEASGPNHDEEFVKRGGKWKFVTADGRLMNGVSGAEAVICDLAIPLLTARDSRVPEVGQ